MKRPKVSPVYQGKRRKGCPLELGSSGSGLPAGFQIQPSLNPPQNMTPILSLPTRHPSKVRKPSSITPNERTIITRSMSMNADCIIGLDDDQKKDVKALHEEKKDDQEVVAKVDEMKEEIKGEEKTETKPLEGPASSDVLEGLVDWPLTWTYEEEWMWAMGSGVGCYSYWETMSGVTGAGTLDVEDYDDDIWGFDDIWQLRKIKEIPKP